MHFFGVTLTAIALVCVACGSSTNPTSTTTLVITVTDHEKPVGARVQLFDAQNRPVHIGALDLYRPYGTPRGTGACSFAPSVLGTWDGLILADGSANVPIGVDACVPTPGIAYGRYHVVAWRGIEYEKWEGDVDLSPGRGEVRLAIALERAWTPRGTLAADLHVHAQASSDSKVPNAQRVIAQAASGIQVVTLTDHDTNGDLDAEIAALQLDDRIASIAGNELTAHGQHIGVFPVPFDRSSPRGGAPPVDVDSTAAALFAIGRAMKTNPIIQVNHPRSRVGSLFDTTHWDGVTWPPPFQITFDAVEVVGDPGVRDYYTFVDHGRLLIGVGGSDTHDLDSATDGTPRTYVFVDDARTNPFDESAFMAALHARRTVATVGPWLEVAAASKEGATQTVGPGQAVASENGAVWLDVTVSRARWVKVEQIRVTIGSPAGPKVVQTIAVVPNERSHHWAGRIEVGPADTWIGVMADGAFASPILVDGDRDGHWKRGVGVDIALP